MLTKFIWD